MLTSHLMRILIILMWHLFIVNCCLLDVYICCCCAFLFDYLNNYIATSHTNGPSPWTFISFTCLRFQGCTRRLASSSWPEWVCGNLYWRSGNRRPHDQRNDPRGDSSWIEKVTMMLVHSIQLSIIIFLLLFPSSYLHFRLYTQLEYLKNKTLRQDNPHISKRRGGRKVAHRRFSLQVKLHLT